VNQKSIDFKNRLIKNSVSIIDSFKKLNRSEANQIFLRQIIRSSSSVGANYQEAQVSQSKREFIAKLNISLKEANETLYWLELIEATNKTDLSNNKSENLEIIKILTSIIKSTNNNNVSSNVKCTM
jgi:four helix bundle protein